VGIREVEVRAFGLGFAVLLIVHLYSIIPFCDCFFFRQRIMRICSINYTFPIRANYFIRLFGVAARAWVAYISLQNRFASAKGTGFYVFTLDFLCLP
jgi:hypothetical protein